MSIFNKVPLKKVVKRQQRKDDRVAFKGQSFKTLMRDVRKLAEKTGEKYGVSAQVGLYQLTLNGQVIEEMQSCSSIGLRNKVREVYYDILFQDGAVEFVKQGDDEFESQMELLKECGLLE